MNPLSGPVTISGSLKDVSVTDVLQFIHIGHRSGTLVLEENGLQASLRFHDGRLVRASAPKTPKLGEMLITSGRLTQDRLVAAVAVQQRPGESRSLGQILVDSGSIGSEDLRNLVSQQISQAVSEVVNWENGGFAFVVDDEKPVDDIALYPSDVLPDSDLNIQMVLLEAARLFDEKDRHDQMPMAPPDTTVPIHEVEPPAERTLGPRVQVVSNQPDFALRLRIELVGQRLAIDTVEADDAGIVPANESPPVVIVDLEHGTPLRLIEEITRRAPRAACLALTGRQSQAEVYAAGALAALPGGDFAAVAVWIKRVAESRRGAARAAVPENQDVERLRRVFSELRSGMVSATVALNLMRIISESFDRAVLFLVRRDQLSAIGAVGHGPEGRPLALLTRSLRLPLDAAEPFAKALATGEAQRAPFAAETLPPELFSRLGEPRSGEFAVIPVLGVQRPIALVYADQGDTEGQTESIELLELAAAQVGIAFENELLRRQVPGNN